MDLDPYPGPYELDLFQDVEDFAKALSDTFTMIYDGFLVPVVEAYKPIITNVMSSVEWLYELVPPPHESTRPPIQDRDKPAGITRYRHGPYEGSSYTLRGRKMY